MFAGLRKGQGLAAPVADVMDRYDDRRVSGVPKRFSVCRRQASVSHEPLFKAYFPKKLFSKDLLTISEELQCGVPANMNQPN